MDKSLHGAIALVTGAAGGIGRAICAQMQDAGAIVIATDLATTKPDVPCEIYLQHDVADPARWAEIAKEVEHRYGKLDCLVNNAGYSIVESIEGTSLDAWRKVQAINVESILHSLHVFTPMLRKAGASRPGGSSIVNLSSVGGLRGAAFNAAYCTSKGAVKLFTKSAAIEFGVQKWPIRVNSVHPGGIETPMMFGIMDRYVELGAVPSIEAAQAGVVTSHPIGRLGHPEEIAAGVVFLCSPGASFMTGSELVIDGGFTAR
ncbi:MAG: SDR family oxidoreductase [Caulobacterales bacterium]